MKMQNLQDLLLDQVRDLYDAEKQLVKALPKMAEAASSPQLKRAFEDHWQQTKGHVTRLEEVFKHLSHSPKAKSCKAMEGLVEEGAELIDAKAEPEVRDAGLIAAAQKVEHYEIAGYGSSPPGPINSPWARSSACWARPWRRKSRPISFSTRSRKADQCPVRIAMTRSP